MVSQKKSLHGLQRKDGINFGRVILATANVLPRHALEKVTIPERSPLDSGIRDDTLDVFGQLPPEPASIMEKFVVPKDFHFRANSLENGIEREEPVGHPFIVEIVNLKAGFKK
jgi:hypothetical protein